MRAYPVSADTRYISFRIGVRPRIR